MDGAVLQIAEFPGTTHWTRWSLNIPPNLYEPMVQFLLHAHYKSKNMQYFTCMWSTHPCPSITISPLTAISIFSHTQASFPTLVAPNILLSSHLTTHFSSWEDCSTFTSSKVHTAAQSPLFKPPWIVSQLMILFPISILCPKNVTHVKDTWNRCQLISLAGRLLALPLLTLVQMCQNGSRKRARNEYCNLTVVFFWCIWYLWR